MRLYYVFRKPNIGDYSIEKIYNSIFENVKKQNFDYLFKIQLKRNYDFLVFLKWFLKSFFTPKFIVHITGGCSYMTLCFPFKNRVLTIHDFIRYKQLKGLKKLIYKTFYISLPLHLAHKIVAVSESTKIEILEHMPLVISKVCVIDNPMIISTELIKIRDRKFSINAPIKILQIGAGIHKNYERLIQATRDLNVNYYFIHSRLEHIKNLIKKYKIEECSYIFSTVSEERLCEIYNECDVLYFASESEGFGLPIIEAQAFGLPVITSNLAPMSNIGKGGILVNPFDIQDIRNGFLLLYEGEVVNNNSSKAANNTLNFSLKNITNQYLLLYQSIK